MLACSIQEVKDPVILQGFVIATGLNALLALQMVMYWKQSPKDKGGKRKAKKE